MRIRHLLGRDFCLKELIMWKIAVGFIIFAALALYLLSKGGDVDMSGEKHGSVSMAASFVNA
jgi:hypothetical protein